MAIKLGADAVVALKLGADDVAKVYLGASLAFSGDDSGGYVAKAVQIAGTDVLAPKVVFLPCTINVQQITVSLWSKPDSVSGFASLLALSNPPLLPTYASSLDYGYNNAGDVTLDVQNDTLDEFTQSSTGSTATIDWQGIFANADFSQANGMKTGTIYRNETPIKNPSLTYDSGSDGFPLTATGLFIPDWGGLYVGGAFADVEIYDSKIDLAANLQYFISGGRPVDPATRQAHIGAPLVRLSGDKDGFLTNAGSLGGMARVETVFAPNYGAAVPSGSVPKSIAVSGLTVGMTVGHVFVSVLAGTNSDITDLFELTISVDGHIQQTSGPDLSAGDPNAISVFIVTGTLTNASSPSGGGYVAKADNSNAKADDSIHRADAA